MKTVYPLFFVFGFYRKKILYGLLPGLILLLQNMAYTQAFTTTLAANTNNCNDPYNSLAYAPNNDIYNFWMNDIGILADPNRMYTLGKWNGSSWTTVGSFTTKSLGAYMGNGNHQLAIDKAGAFHIAFKTVKTDDPGWLRNVWHGKSTDGVNWTYTRVVEFRDMSLGSEQELVMRIDGNNNPHIALLQEQYVGVFFTKAYYIKYFKFNGSNWTAQDVFTQLNSSGAIREPGFDLDQNGYAHLAFQRQTNDSGADGGLWYMNNTSGSWPANPTELVHGANGSEMGFGNNVEVDNGGRVHIIHYDYQNHLYYSTNESGAWTHSWINNDLVGTIGHQSFHLNGNGDKFFAFNTSNPRRIKYAYQKAGQSCWVTGGLV